jgi:Nucleotidyl transferase AbiEii toxin, Type IV TA system
MIPRDYITAWREHAPWVQDIQVEQDLVISRALAEIYAHPLWRSSLAFRGGTALYKLHILPPARYWEDIDLVQIKAEPIGAVLEVLRRPPGRPDCPRLEMGSLAGRIDDLMLQPSLPGTSARRCSGKLSTRLLRGGGRRNSRGARFQA